MVSLGVIAYTYIPNSLIKGFETCEKINDTTTQTIIRPIIDALVHGQIRVSVAEVEDILQIVTIYHIYTIHIYTQSCG